MFEINGVQFELVQERGNAYQENKIIERWSDVLDRYDFILGDWGYEQLRLKGFFDDQNPKATHENKASFMNEYLTEYCNFGCPYFILRRVDK